MIQVQSVTKCYGTLTAVENISFSLSPGDIVGFVGPNGAGKSTVLKMLSTYLYPTEGTITVDGWDVVEHSLSVRRKIGYLSGDTPLYQTMRVDKFLRFCGKARGLRGEILEKNFQWVVDICGLSPHLYKRINQCSTGFRQRIGLGSALIHDPPILLLDEPTHGFDPLQVMAFRDLLRTLSTDRVILFSSHIIQEVETLSDRVLLIHEGHLLADGTLDSLYQDTGQSNLENVFSHLVKTSQSHA
ncbi:MAG: ATP-binding cassette domain-containing protein [bacterium]|nr:ATP-binding cassette domain-containing protein [bacterium]